MSVSALKRLAGSPFARSVGVLASGTAVGQGLIILASLALTRLYSPEDFGSFAVFSATLFCLLQLASMRYDWAVLVPESDREAASLLVLSLGIATAVSAVTGGAVLLWGDRLTRWTNSPSLAPHLWLLPVSLWAAGIYQAFNAWCTRRKSFHHVAWSQVSQNLARVVFQIGLGFLHPGALGLMAGDVVGRWAGAGELAARARRDDPGALSGVRAKEVFKAASRYRRFPLFSSGASLLHQAGLQLTPLLIAVLYGAPVAGWYSLGQRVVGLPLVTVGNSISQVYAGHASELARNDAPALRRLFLKTSLVLGLAGSVPFGLMAVLGPWLFSAVFGREWVETGRYFQVLAPMCLVQLVVVPLAQTLAILERQSVQLGWDVVRLALLVGVFVASWYGGLSPYHAIALFGGAMTAAYIVLYLLMLSGVARGEGSPDSGEGSPDSGEGSPSSGEGSPSSGEGSPDSGEGSPNSGEGSPNRGERSPEFLA